RTPSERRAFPRAGRKHRHGLFQLRSGRQPAPLRELRLRKNLGAFARQRVRRSSFLSRRHSSGRQGRGGSGLRTPGCRRGNDQELRQSEERFRELAENIGMVFFNYDPVANRLLYANSAYEKIWERSLASVFADPLSYLDGIHPDDKAAAEAAYERQVAGEETF